LNKKELKGRFRMKEASLPVRYHGRRSMWGERKKPRGGGKPGKGHWKFQHPVID